jgi:class 3 adenylate cyclase
MLTRIYQRFGPGYPQLVLGVLLRVEHLILVIGTVVLALYVPISLGDFALLILAALAWQEFYALFTLHHFRRRLTPLVRWLEGERTAEEAIAAWRVAASMPYELLRLWWRGGYPAIAGLGWCLFAVWLLGLPAWTIPVLFLVIQSALAFGNGVPFFGLEFALQPLHDDLAAHLSEEAEARALSMPLRRRLLVALPALGVGTAIIVVGIFEGGHPGVGRMAVVALISLAVALIGFLPFVLLVTGSVVAPIRRLQDAAEDVGAGDLATRVPVVADDETGALTRAFNRMTSGLQERERLRDAFGAFVDSELAERVSRDGTDLRGEELEVSVLFMDVRGFTTLSENAAARDLVGRLNELYDRVVPVILRHGGHANKFIGDGLLAVFGAPERHRDHADRAVAAALEIARVVNGSPDDGLRVGLGINTGTVVVGTIGGGGRLDFTVIGDPVNTAARVESATRETGDDLLITEETRRRLSAKHGEWAERPPIQLRGKQQAVRLYAPARVTARPLHR